MSLREQFTFICDYVRFVIDRHARLCLLCQLTDIMVHGQTCRSTGTHYPNSEPLTSLCSHSLIPGSFPSVHLDYFLIYAVCNELVFISCCLQASSCLCYVICLLGYSVQYILCCVSVQFFFVLCKPMLTVSLDYQVLIAPSVFSNIYLHYFKLFVLSFFQHSPL